MSLCCYAQVFVRLVIVTDRTRWVSRWRLAKRETFSRRETRWQSKRNFTEIFTTRAFPVITLMFSQVAA